MKQHTNNLAILVDEAAKSAQEISQLSLANSFDLEDAYTIQKLSIDKRLERGEKLIGYKLGFTSKAKMEQMGLNDVIWGRLTDAMTIENGGVLDSNQFIHPRAEPEIAFRVSKRIDQILTSDNVNDYFDAVAPAIEIIDSRYKNFKFSLEDVIADNCSSSAYILGKWHVADTPVNHLSISLLINNSAVQEGNSNAILGNPVDSLIEMSKMAFQYNEPIEAGKIILAGAATPAEYIHKGDKIEGHFENLGAIRLSVI
jgi:2-keto-4-pentenoate hydratase